MKFIADFFREDGWFLGNVTRSGSLQVAHRRGVFETGPLHCHPLRQEYFIVLSGQAELIVDGRPLTLQRGNVVLVEPGESHSLQGQSPDFSLLVLMDQHIEGDKQLLTGEEAPCTNV